MLPAEVPAEVSGDERRSGERLPRVTYHGDTARLVLALPDHRVHAGSTVSYAGLDGEVRRVTLPVGSGPERAVRVETGEQYSWPTRVELVVVTL